MIKAIFFDLFFTLICPQYNEEANENDILKITAEEWEHYAEKDELYMERALGKIKDEKQIIVKIIDSMPYKVSEQQVLEILTLRQNRMKNALCKVDETILHTLKEIHDKGIKICLISNADVIDSKYWSESPLADYFDEVIFSCDVGMMKPDASIYEYAIRKVNVAADESLFVGDGGFDELAGAKRVGMKAVFTEYLDIKEGKKRARLLEESDYYIRQFDELLKIEGI
ncbi:HAD family hydrolase [Anaeromicropila herbilytica]|uniref:Haloacid dehalogenase n=1 Tax=Anaeromicropila herbilytica TaxID=2785025 RepID=A0A7R7EKV6_9FIRM|nr:HAD-IA family hydrolase [Anaeromicropila herbilytica]BCN30761.1 haloacid dehalogenase [Anaeromicropila herbilytica]